MGTVTGWRKASYSGNGGNNCVEVGQGSAAIALRDTKNPDGVTLIVPAAAWAAFAARLK